MFFISVFPHPFSDQRKETVCVLNIYQVGSIIFQVPGLENPVLALEHLNSHLNVGWSLRVLSTLPGHVKSTQWAQDLLLPPKQKKYLKPSQNSSCQPALLFIGVIDLQRRSIGQRGNIEAGCPGAELGEGGGGADEKRQRSGESLRGEEKQEAKLRWALRAAELQVSWPGCWGRGSLWRAGRGAHSFWGRQAGQVAERGRLGWWSWVDGLGSHSGNTAWSSEDGTVSWQCREGREKNVLEAVWSENGQSVCC